MITFGRLILAGLVAGIPVSAPAAVEERPAASSEQVTIADVDVRMSDHGPVVLLRAEGKAIPIFVDMTVAISIEGALKGEKLARPLTHDLMHTILDTYGGRVTQTVITLKGGTYYGALSIAFRGDVKVFDSRSSDSIALAIHFKAPIVVSRELLNQAGIVPDRSKAEDL